MGSESEILSRAETRWTEDAKKYLEERDPLPVNSGNWEEVFVQGWVAGMRKTFAGLITAALTTDHIGWEDEEGEDGS